ncbi:Alpha/Beta hydrolase protein [Mycena galopus ATCC 62051]|nr:Alpha/Beta hydrolase protein [Mycena galopus ATCC 62051]
MPRRIDLQTSTGSESFAYTISTPTDVSATKIVQGLPTILLIHAVYVMSAMFHSIYEDPRLRRFNLVAMDLRGHGWTSAKVDETYGREIAAQDILKLMEALEIPACHVVGVSMGASVALQMATVAPKKVLSLFLLSPPSRTEPAHSIEGRQEIYNCWTEAFDHPSGVDPIAHADSVMGGSQITYNNIETPLTKAVTLASVAAATRNWAPRDNFHIMHTTTVKYFMHGEAYSVSALTRIRCPILLVHCGEDIVTPLSSTEELLAFLHKANIEASLCTIKGAPHIGSVTHPKETNTLLYDFVLANSSASDLPPHPTYVESPFLEELAAFGLLGGEDSESEIGDDV